MIEGVFFDLYGTLLIYGDMDAALQAQIITFHRFLLEKGGDISLEQLATQYVNIMGQPASFASPNLSPFENQLEEVCRAVGKHMPPDEISQLAPRIVSAWQSFITLDPFSLPLIKSLHQRYRTALISNFDYPPHIVNLLSNLGMKACFDSIVVSGTVGITKPDRRIFEIALEETRLEASNVVFVGDTAVDVQGAKNSGLLPVLIQRPGTAPLDPEIISNVKMITDLSQLPDWLGQLG